MACSHETARGPCCGMSYLHDQRLKTSSPSWKPGSSPGIEGRPGLQRLHFVPVVLLKHPDRSNAREKGRFGSPFPFTAHPRREVKAGNVEEPAHPRDGELVRACSCSGWFLRLGMVSETLLRG